MRVRYTQPAARELDASISSFLEHAPSFAVDFAESIDRALMRLLDHPYSAQETERRGIRRVSDVFATRSSTRLMATRSWFSMSDTLLAVHHGKDFEVLISWRAVIATMPPSAFAAVSPHCAGFVMGASG